MHPANVRTRAVRSRLLPALLFLLPACTVDAPATEAASSEAPSTGAAPAKPLTIQIPGSEAGKVLAAALDEAGQTERYLFVHTGADW